jgi:hypothetical protein
MIQTALRPSTREKRAKMELVINAKGNLSGNTVRQGNTSALAIDRMQKQIGSLSDENSKLRSSLVTAQEQICETLERFPNFKAEKNVKVPVDGKVHELENVVARNCEKFRDLLGSLNKHNVKQLQDLARNGILAARDMLFKSDKYLGKAITRRNASVTWPSKSPRLSAKWKK